MKISKVYSSPYLRAVDMEGPRTWTIESVEALEFDEGNKPAVHFHESEKPLVLNRTNAKRLVSLFGDDTDGWIRKQIELFVIEIEFQGESKAAIRVRTPLEKAPF